MSRLQGILERTLIEDATQVRGYHACGAVAFV